MKLSGKIEIEFSSEKTAKDAELAISHDIFDGDRSQAKIKREGSKMLVMISAEDVVSFRAAANTLLRDFQVIESEGKLNGNKE